MRNITITRIDERLIHGQIVTSWMKVTGVNTVIVVEDGVAKNDFLKRALRATAPKGVEVLILSVDECVNYLNEEKDEKQKIMIITKGPQGQLALMEKGVPFTEIILGNMGMSSKRKRFTKNISASDEELDVMRRITAAGVPIYQQMIPADAKVNIDKFL